MFGKGVSLGAVDSDVVGCEVGVVVVGESPIVIFSKPETPFTEVIMSFSELVYSLSRGLRVIFTW